MKKLKISAAEMVAAARARVTEVDTEGAIARHGDPDVVFVDLRDPRERQRSGFIPGSFHCPRGMLEFWVDPESPYYKEAFGAEKTFILHCASGWRSALSAAMLNDMGFEAAHLKDGFTDWAAKGGPVAFPEPKG
ncbi:rhodanese-like domain-containing protein [Acuticoccus mangrovi]|uniref:Rhodanese-like domain-containing protein n=1 Tax=Acuticoccus mangrovi TaxID=2796142 RepID=A0A934MGN8_9HYPH|nr:rhodanese-like domain-containing protein [Acuticoccus mangrovi]MBJ3776110.1 rhodanese-like domain-containing protein [Acuticoccus mangrovi]